MHIVIWFLNPFDDKKNGIVNNPNADLQEDTHLYISFECYSYVYQANNYK